jgi:hypothetical protein
VIIFPGLYFALHEFWMKLHATAEKKESQLCGAVSDANLQAEQLLQSIRLVVKDNHRPFSQQIDNILALH